MKEEIYEPSFEKEVLDGFKEDEVSMAIAGVLPSGVSPLKAVSLFDQDRIEKLMDGAIDTHMQQN